MSPFQPGKPYKSIESAADDVWTKRRELSNYASSSKRKRTDDEMTDLTTPPATASSSTSTTTTPASTSAPDEASRLLLRYDVIIIDEAHERTLNTDFLLGSLKSIQAERKRLTSALKKGRNGAGSNDNADGDQEVDILDASRYRGFEMRELKLVVMSATIDAEKFSSFFNR